MDSKLRELPAVNVDQHYRAYQHLREIHGLSEASSAYMLRFEDMVQPTTDLSDVVLNVRALSPCLLLRMLALRDATILFRPVGSPIVLWHLVNVFFAHQSIVNSLKENRARVGSSSRADAACFHIC